MNDEDELVLVTGASGYIATHIVKQLLDAGYRVRGTVRSIKDEKKCAPLRKLSENSKHKLELCEANLLKQDGWSDAVKGCAYVLHTASPFPPKVPKNENELIEPAVNGTLFVLRACSEPDSTVKRVVLTSSTAAIVNENFTDGKEFSEVDWPNESETHGYPKSKLLAEKAAWNFVEEKKKKNEPCFDLAVINPSFVLGPVINNADGTSMEIMIKILNGTSPMVPKVSMGMCDVRDVAQAHIIAMKKPECNGHRHMIVSTRNAVWFKEMTTILDAEFGPKGYKIATREAPNFAIRIFSLFEPSLKLITPVLGKSSRYDTTRFTSVLGIKPYELKQTLVDMAKSLEEKQLIKK